MVKQILPLLLCVALCGCASIISDNKSTTYIETDPETARCELHGQDFKRIVTTPNSIGLPSEAAPITVSCTAPGYKRTTGNLDTKMDGWIFGNILLGGGIGLIVDAAKGSGFKYPPKFTLIMEPEEFRTLDDRDAWYDRRKTELETRWTDQVKRVRSQCARDNTGIGGEDACKRIVADEEKKKAQELEQNEKARGAAKVAQVAQAAAKVVDGLTTVAPGPQSSLCLPELIPEDDLLAGRGCCSHHRGQCGCEGGRVACCDGSLSPSCRCEKDEGKGG